MLVCESGRTDGFLTISGKPLTPREDQDFTHADQLLTASGAWNEELIWNCFISVDADAILKIPVTTRMTDIWSWEPEKHGIYSVKSAYKLLYNVKQEQNMAEQGTSSDDSWKRIWKLDVPPKVKVFWWRVIHEFLPAKHVLHKRHIE